MDVREFIAHQLNDHDDSPSGVEQPIYTEWSKRHIEKAISLAINYLYSILPSAFTSIQTKITTTTDCIVSFCEECVEFAGLVKLEIDGVDCIKLVKMDTQTNDLLGMLHTGCGDEHENPHIYRPIDNMPCAVAFDHPVPQGTKISYVCAKPNIAPDDFINSEKFTQYTPLIADYALWWLYRTDTESRSNLDRARLHFEGVKDYVTNTLMMKFTLHEDDYNFGRRKVDDD